MDTKNLELVRQVEELAKSLQDSNNIAFQNNVTLSKQVENLSQSLVETQTELDEASSKLSKYVYDPDGNFGCQIDKY